MTDPANLQLLDNRDGLRALALDSLHAARQARLPEDQSLINALRGIGYALLAADTVLDGAAPDPWAVS